MSESLQMVIETEATIRCLYDEAIDFSRLGRQHISRGSHVEPDQNGNWLANLSPVGGPVLGPFSCRSLALDAERVWLEKNWLAASA